MKINCSINGRAVPKANSKISIFDNSLFYADGLFETFLAINDQVIFLDDHLERLQNGADLIRLELPATREKLKRWIISANRKNSAPVKKLRVTITAGESSFWAGKRGRPQVLIIVTEYAPPSKPFSLSVASFRVDQENPFRKVKTLSFIIEMTSRKNAYASQFDDAILLNRKGNVAETTSANIFWVKNGILYTPPLSAGCLEGMTRKHIQQLARSNGIKAREKNIKLDGLLKADEIFITSSLKLVIPVGSIYHEKNYNYRIGPVTREIKRLLIDSISK